MKHGSQFVTARPMPEAVSRLFCFPHAGGGPVAFFDWSQRFGGEIECVCLQYAGRGQRLREQPQTCVEGLIGDIGLDFSAFADKPFAFYGHSFGGIVAFELARQMTRSGLPGPHHLFVGATRPPHLPLRYPPIHQLADREFVESIQLRYGGIPATIFDNPELLEMFLPAMRADFTGYETYRFEPSDPLTIPITAFAGAEDSAVALDSLQQWALHTNSGFDINVLSGGHFFPTVSGLELIRVLKTRIGAHLRDQNVSLAS